ncbi:hypothetical protein [Neobacillus sp. 19]|uniref:hypothetical protein n=1 Tax=Neobacillus sp. 19 TaxID=3394458 RepID=UPI003BF7050D
MKVYVKIIFVLMLSFSLVSLSGCFGKDKATEAEGKKTSETDQSTKKAKAAEQSTEKAKTTEQSPDKTKATESTTDKAKATEQSTDKAKAPEQSTSKAKETNQSSNNTKESNQSTSKPKETNQPAKEADKKAPDTQTVGEKEVTDFVLKNTRIVQISSISKRSKEEFPDLGPFFVIRGIDLRGETSEVWVKDMKIFEMETQAKN